MRSRGRNFIITADFHLALISTSRRNSFKMEFNSATWDDWFGPHGRQYRTAFDASWP